MFTMITSFSFLRIDYLYSLADYPQEVNLLVYPSGTAYRIIQNCDGQCLRDASHSMIHSILISTSLLIQAKELSRKTTIIPVKDTNIDITDI